MKLKDDLLHIQLIPLEFFWRKGELEKRKNEINNLIKRTKEGNIHTKLNQLLEHIEKNEIKKANKMINDITNNVNRMTPEEISDLEIKVQTQTTAQPRKNIFWKETRAYVSKLYHRIAARTRWKQKAIPLYGLLGLLTWGQITDANSDDKIRQAIQMGPKTSYTIVDGVPVGGMRKGEFTQFPDGSISKSSSKTTNQEVENDDYSPANAQQKQTYTIDQLNEAIKQNPNIVENYLLLANQQKTPEEKINTLETALKQKKANKLTCTKDDLVEIYYALGLEYHTLGKYEKSIENFEQVKKTDPNHRKTRLADYNISEIKLSRK